MGHPRNPADFHFTTGRARNWGQAACSCHAPAQGHYFDEGMRCTNGKRALGLLCGRTWQEVQDAWALNRELPCPLTGTGVKSTRRRKNPPAGAGDGG